MDDLHVVLPGAIAGRIWVCALAGASQEGPPSEPMAFDALAPVRGGGRLPDLPLGGALVAGCGLGGTRGGGSRPAALVAWGRAAVFSAFDDRAPAAGLV